MPLKNWHHNARFGQHPSYCQWQCDFCIISTIDSFTALGTVNNMHNFPHMSLSVFFCAIPWPKYSFLFCSPVAFIPYCLACLLHACPLSQVCPFCSTFLSTTLLFQHLRWLITHICSQQSLGLNVVIALRVKECKQISTRCLPWQTVINEVEIWVETRSAFVFLPFFLHMLHSIISWCYFCIYLLYIMFKLGFKTGQSERILLKHSRFDCVCPVLNCGALSCQQPHVFVLQPNSPLSLICERNLMLRAH